jgi:hypothetical protein
VNKLVTDLFVRRVAQLVLILTAFSVVVACLVFDLLVVGYYRGAVDASRWPLAYAFVQGIGAFYGNDWSTLLTTIAGIFPVVVSSVCYRVVKEDAIKVTEELNFVGHAFFGFSVLTVVLLLLAMGMLTTLKSSVLALLGGQDGYYNSIRELANSALSAYAIYIVQFVGLRAR